MAAETPLLEVESLVKHFLITQGIVFRRQIGSVRAVDGVSFTLHHGETLGLVGESGCGKSTVARLLLRLEQATSGHARYKGEDIFTCRPSACGGCGATPRSSSRTPTRR
jgi:oligopeptide transport system ATP-binding protein